MFEKIGKFIDRYKTELLFMLVTAAYTSTSYFFSTTTKFFNEKVSGNQIGWFIIAICIIVNVFTIINKIKNKEVEKEKELIVGELNKCKKTLERVEKSYFDLCSDNIASIFRELNFNSTERISIYKHTGKNFVILGRFSQNPTYNKKHRDYYPDNEGFIQLGWERGDFFINNIPEWRGKGKEYKVFVQNINPITDRTLNKLIMQSRSFYIRTLNDNSTAQNPDGIIVIESMLPNGIQRECIDNLINREMNKLLPLLKKMSSFYNLLEKN